MATAAQAAYLDDPLKNRRFATLAWDDVALFRHAPTKTAAFVASNQDHVVIAFRGTEPLEIENWITNLSYAYHHRKVGGGHVHGGFWDAWYTVRDKIIKRLERTYKNKQTIWLTGHSLGAALATLAGRDLPARFRATGVYTFGSPRCGNPDYSKAYEKTNITVRRFVNETDIVPHVPLQGLFGRYRYDHVGLRQIMLPSGRITSDSGAWIRLLKEFAKIAVLGVGAVGQKSYTDHSMDRYVLKLANHGSNRR